MATKLDSVQDWIGEAKAQGATRVELHSKLDAALIRAWRLADNDAAAGPDELAAQILRRAEREGAAQPAIRVTYRLLAFAGEGANYCDQTLLVVDGGNAKGKSGEVEEYEPTINGLLTQMMRTNLDQTRLILSSQESRHVHAEQLIDRLQKDNEALQGERIKVWTLLEQVQTMHLEREQVRNAMVLEEKRDAFVFDKMNMVLPIFLNRLMGGGPGKGTPYFAEEMVRQLLGSLTPEQTDAMLKNQALQLSESQLGLIAELTLSYAEREKQKRPLNPVVVEAGQNGAPSKESPS